MNILLIGGLLFAAYAMAWPQICPMIGMQGCPTTSLFQDVMANMGGGAAPPVEEAPPAEGEGEAPSLPGHQALDACIKACGAEGGNLESCMQECENVDSEGGDEGGDGEAGEGEGGESYYVRAYPGYARISAY